MKLYTLKMLRAKDGLTQKQVAQKMGISESTWHKWEHRKSFPDVEQVMKIEEIFGVRYDQIIFLDSNTVLP